MYNMYIALDNLSQSDARADEIPLDNEDWKETRDNMSNRMISNPPPHQLSTESPPPLFFFVLI